MVLYCVSDNPQNPHRHGSWGSVEMFLCFGQSVSFRHTLFQSHLHSQYLSHSHSLRPLPSCIRLPCLPLGSDVNALPIRLSIKQPCTRRSSGRPQACMQISSNCSAAQTPWNLLWVGGGDREWTCRKCREKWAPAHLFYANENKKAKNYKGLPAS